MKKQITEGQIKDIQNHIKIYGEESLTHALRSLKRKDVKTLTFRQGRAVIRLMKAFHQDVNRPIFKKKNLIAKKEKLLNKKGDVFIYFISVNNEFVKIGYAKDIDSRMKTLQTSSPYPLKLECNISGTQQLETIYHRLFIDKRVNGEWFILDDEIKSEINRLSNGS